MLRRIINKVKKWWHYTQCYIEQEDYFVDSNEISTSNDICLSCYDNECPYRYDTLDD